MRSSVQTGQHKNGMACKYLLLLKGEEDRFVGKWRFRYQIIAFAMKSVGAEMDHIAIVAAMCGGILVIGKPIVQYLPGRNAECKQHQQYTGE